VFSLAVPEKEGVRLLDGDFGATIVTTGGSVLTSKLTGALVPGSLPIPLTSVADAEKTCLPAGRGLLSAPVVNDPPEAIVFAFATSVGPSNTRTTTSVFSLAVPEKVGLVLLEGDGGALRVTDGASVSTTKVAVELVPWALPSPLFSVALTVKVWVPE